MKPKFIVSVLFYLTGISFVVLTCGTVCFMVLTIIINIHDKSKSDFEPIQGMEVGNNISIYGIGSKVDYSYANDSTIRYYPKIGEYRIQVKSNTPLSYYFFLFRLILLAVVTTGSWFFLKILNEIKLGNPFNYRSIKYLKIIALAFITRDILEFINNLIFNQFIHASGIQSRFELPTTLTIGHGIIIGMSIWILAIIFQRGVELQTENDLTV